jgi:hypothetical protein
MLFVGLLEQDLQIEKFIVLFPKAKHRGRYFGLLSVHT